LLDDKGIVGIFATGASSLGCAAASIMKSGASEGFGYQSVLTLA